MQPSLLKLQKIFKLEAEQSFNNRAIIGGFERLAPTWEAEARADNLPEDLIQAIGERLRTYDRLSPASRQEALQGLWKRIQRSQGGADGELEPLRPPPAPAREPARRKETVQPVSQAESPSSVGNDQEAPFEAESVKPESALADDDESPVEPAELSPLPQVVRVRSSEPPAALNASVQVLPGVGPKNAQSLAKLGLDSLGDMLYHYPRRYIDFSQLKPINRLKYGEMVTVIGTVEHANLRNLHSGKTKIVEALLTDGTGALRLTWFNQPWKIEELKGEPQVFVSGKVEQYLGRLVMNNPEIERLEQQQLHTNRIVPVYPLTAKITQRWLRGLMAQVISYWAPRVHDPLPDDLLQEAALPDLPTALLQVHFPDSWEQLDAAHQRLAFDEIFFLQLGVQDAKRKWQSRSGQIFETPLEWLNGEIEKLPYSLTNAQRRVLDELRTDLASGSPMNRLLQGDVGSGKTVVAALAVAMVARHGVQSAVMAPTSILAEQHFKNFLRQLAGEDGLLQAEEIRLLVGATPEAEKNDILEKLESGQIKIIIGTHALIEDPIKFADLQMVVVDEQHRFGVEQRAALRSKGSSPHLLVMTATPIPRSLALTIYGDLDLSVMDEMPPGRQEIGTFVMAARERERVYRLIRSQVSEGRQAFIIYPLVEESESSEAKAAVEEHQHLQKEIFPDLKLGLLHGRMRPDEKDQVMADFRDGNYHILVATSVVEVGVDIPNATVMMVEGANRFGLAQLHQLRGRVGRGGHQSYCVLVPDEDNALENERLAAMSETNDGFVLAERDLAQRGPGSFLGTRQSGYGELNMASLSDVHLIEKARRFAQQVFTKDPDLSLPEHQGLAETMRRVWRGLGSSDIS